MRPMIKFSQPMLSCSWMARLSVRGPVIGWWTWTVVGKFCNSQLKCVNATYMVMESMQPTEFQQLVDHELDEAKAHWVANNADHIRTGMKDTRTILSATLEQRLSAVGSLVSGCPCLNRSWTVLPGRNTSIKLRKARRFLPNTGTFY